MSLEDKLKSEFIVLDGFVKQYQAFVKEYPDNKELLQRIDDKAFEYINTLDDSKLAYRRQQLVVYYYHHRNKVTDEDKTDYWAV